MLRSVPIGISRRPAFDRHYEAAPRLLEVEVIALALAARPAVRLKLFDDFGSSINSLFRETFSLICVEKFPVPLRREFRYKQLKSLPYQPAIERETGLNPRNSLLFSLLAGNLPAETGSHRTASSAI